MTASNPDHIEPPKKKTSPWRTVAVLAVGLLVVVGLAQACGAQDRARDAASKAAVEREVAAYCRQYGLPADCHSRPAGSPGALPKPSYGHLDIDIDSFDNEPDEGDPWGNIRGR